MTSSRPSAERVSAPSEEALPLMMSAFVALSGMAMLPASVPLVVNWSMKTELPELTRLVVPSPMRSTARLPAVNAAPEEFPA